MSDVTPSPRQMEARVTGEQRETVKYLNRNPLIGIIVFSLAIVGGLIWGQLIIDTVSTYIFKTTLNNMKPRQWLIFAVVYTIIMYILLRYVIRVPLTSAFSL